MTTKNKNSTACTANSTTRGSIDEPSKYALLCQSSERFSKSFGAPLVAVGLFLNYMATSETQHWNRAKYTQDLLEQFPGANKEPVSVLRKVFPNLDRRDSGERLSPDRAKQILLATPSQTADYEIRSAVVDVLNYMERVTKAVENRTASEETVKELYGGLFKRRYLFLSAFVEAAQTEFGKSHYRPIDRIVGGWLVEDQEKPTYRWSFFANILR